MSLRSYRSIAVLAACVLLAQSRAGGQKAKVQQLPPTESPIVALETARNHALESGDPTAISAATKAYLSELLIQLAQAVTVEGDQSSADDDYTSALALENTANNRLAYASFLLGTGRADKAILQLRTITEGERANNPNVWVTQARAYRAEGNNKEAADSLEHALRLEQDVNIAYALGSVLLLEHEKNKADTVFREILEATGSKAMWHVAIGDAYRSAHYYNDATGEFAKAIAIDPKTPHAEFFLGLTHLQMNEWGPNPESFLHLRKAVALSPHEYITNFYLGALESTDGSDLPSSDRHLQEAAMADPSQPEVWIYLGLNANREHNDEVAERDLRKAVELTGTNESLNNYQIRRADFALGRLLIARGKKEEGTRFLDKYRLAEKAAMAASSSTIASMNSPSGIDPSTVAAPAVMQGVASPVPDQKPSAPQLTIAQKAAVKKQVSALKHLIAEAYNDLGTAQARQQNYADALQAFLTAEQWETPSPVLLRNIGTAAFRLSNYDKASRALTPYVETASTTDKASTAFQRAGLMLGFSDFNLGKFEDAASAFASVPDATAADPRAAYSWAFSLAHTGHAQEANRIADRLMMQSLPSEQLVLVCHIYVDDENYEGSLACYRKAYEQDPALQLAHYQAGQALVHLNRPQEAIAEIEQEEKLSPGDPNVQFALAYALLQASKKNEAQSLLQRLTTDHPELAEAQYELGKLLLEQGKTESAIAHLQASEKANASPDYVHYQLGIAYKKAGEQANAERELKLYRDIKDKKRAESTVSQPH